MEVFSFLEAQLESVFPEVFRFPRTEQCRPGGVAGGETARIPFYLPAVLPLLLLPVAVLPVVSGRRVRFLPEAFEQPPFRLMACAALLVISFDVMSRAASEVEKSCAASGDLPATGVYEYTRNPVYAAALFGVLPALAILGDCAWLFL